MGFLFLGGVLQAERENQMNERQSSLWQNLRALPRGAWVLFLGTFLNKFGTFVLPFLTIYMTRLGFSPVQAGQAIAAYGLGTIAACMVGGYLADRIGRRTTILLSMSSAAAAMVCLAQAQHLGDILLLSGTAGFTCELYRPASSALLADLVPEGLRITAFTVYRISLNAGFAFGPATAGFLAERSFSWLFIGDAATSLLFGVIAWFALPRNVRREQNNPTGLAEGIRILKADAAFARVLVSSVLIGLVFVQIFSTMSLEITASGFSPKVYGFLISLNGLLVALFELPLTSVTKHWPARWVMTWGNLLIGLGFASNLLPRTAPLLILTTVLFTFGEMVCLPISAAFVAALAPPDRRGFYMGMYGATWAIAFVCGPSLGLAVYPLNSQAVWLGCGVLGALAAWVIAPRRSALPVLGKVRLVQD